MQPENFLFLKEEKNLFSLLSYFLCIPPLQVLSHKSNVVPRTGPR